MFKIAVLPGDGIGPEITVQAVRVLEAVGRRYNHQFEFKEGLVGGAALDAMGTPLPAETLELCRTSDAILFGAVGGPKWDGLPLHLRPEAGGILALRKEFGLYANLRPVKVYPSLVGASPLKPELVRGVDIMVLRELTGGLYFGKKYWEPLPEGGFRVVDTLEYTTPEIERILRLAFELASKRRRKVTSVDKANVLGSSRHWREVASAVGEEYPDVELEHMYVDNCAMQLVKNPKQFDVLVTENMFGDILSDQASVLAGSLGMLASASLGSGIGLYEPVHGTAPDIAGKQLANPIAAILSAAMLLRFSLNLAEEADCIERAVAAVLEQGYRTADLMEDGKTRVSTAEMGDRIIEQIESQ
ncbi:MAG TPA: 3-isopropylmalate dehydrogenase [Bacillota bacterium]|jgi:3-isopropylmalate dehydrogenase|nr:3-isopropylmalate dehydrogenase [Peptococcaceae bacterium MAG4]NLW38304.1 3-isopropylmalate dehydrogenase [Peptococcaceae bacterium]HPZ44132.1 3-isopropylmalate dehydrogenase [Bacillota bacterium]HQD76756.1 3-isopropylmalate dehydrogenase [Bacillota bacterium]HUM59378.1 3-isopropylmalate dehydrogenase [Bacillota bacterium]